MKIIAVYVTYNPEINILDKSINSLENQVEEIIIVDNTEDKNNQQAIGALAKKYSKITLITLGENKGIASAMNEGYGLAIRKKADWILSMDQDSILPPETISQYQEFIERTNSRQIGALLPSFFLCPTAVNVRGGEDKKEIDYMTSGSLVNAKAFLEVKGFEDKLFIDLVDRDFGLKLILAGYSMYRLGNIIMNHNIGNAKDITFFHKHLFYITNHNSIRRYYISRNLFYIAEKYGKLFPKFSHPNYAILKSVIRIIFFENNKIPKLQSVVRGIVDYRKNKYGKYTR